MANAMNVLNEDEKKYFESRGEHEPEGYSELPRQDSETESTSGEEQEFSERIDEPTSAGDGGQETDRYETSSGEDEQYQPEPATKQSKRDFSKAYGIAESKRQELKAQLEQQAYQNQLLQQQIQMLMQQQQGVQQPQPSREAIHIPDPNEDPLGYQAYQLEHLNKTVSAQQQYLEQQAKAYQQQQAEAALDNAYRASAMEYMKEAPDFMDAYKFLENSRIQEYMALGYSPQESARLLREDERALAAKSFKEKANPAQRIYAAAKARGFSSPNAESKLEKVSKGMQKGKSLPRAGGKNLEKAYDISRLDDMSDAEFDEFFNQVKAESKRNGDYRKDFY